MKLIWKVAWKVAWKVDWKVVWKAGKSLGNLSGKWLESGWKVPDKWPGKLESYWSQLSKTSGKYGK